MSDEPTVVDAGAADGATTSTDEDTGGGAEDSRDAAEDAGHDAGDPVVAARDTVDADGEAADQLEQVRGLSRLLDESIALPGGYRIGLDPIVGVVPVVGDLGASAVSVYIVMEAAYLGVPPATLARMVLNVLVDTVFGSVPVVGPVFDAVFKANARNVALLESRLDEPTAAGADRRALLALGTLLVAFAVALSVAVGAGVLWLAGEVGAF